MFKVEVKNAAELNMLDKQWRNRNRKDLVEQEKLKLEKDLKVIFIVQYNYICKLDARKNKKTKDSRSRNTTKDYYQPTTDEEWSK